MAPRTELKLAQRVQRAGLTSGNCGPGDIFQTWDCQTLDQGPYSLGGEIDMVITARGGLFLGTWRIITMRMKSTCWQPGSIISLGCR